MISREVKNQQTPQPKEKDKKIEIKLEEKEAYPNQLSIVRRLQSLHKLKISRLRTLKATKNIGENSEINIDLESKENLKKIKGRLKKRLFYLSPIEKEGLKNSDYLTLSEKKLYCHLLQKEYILHHTTPYECYKQIQASGNMLVDPQEAIRRKIPMRPPTTTPYGGVDNNIFFGLGTYTSTLPDFVRACTEKKYDYCVIRINYSKLIKEQPDLLLGHWCSGHFHHFSLATEHYKMSSPVPIGQKLFSWSYLLRGRYFPDKQKPLKYLVYEHRLNKEIQEQRVGLKDEIAVGKDMLPFFCLLFIERLRYIGGEFRENLLKPPYKETMIDKVMESVFRVDDFEVKCPTSFSLNNPFTEVITPQRRREITMAVNKAAAEGKIEILESLKNQHCPLFGYMYEDPYYYDEGFPATGLPILAAIKNTQLKAVEWLIDNGAITTAISSKPEDQELCKSLILAALNTQNLELIELLIQAGIDFNTPWDLSKDNCSGWSLNPFYDFTSDHDFIAREIFILSSKEDQITFLEKMKDKLNFIKRPNENILKDLGRYGTQKILGFFIKYCEEKIDCSSYINIIKHAVLYNNEDYIIFLLEDFKKTFLLNSAKEKTLIELLWLAFGKGLFKIVDKLIKENPHTLADDKLKNFYNSFTTNSNTYKLFFPYITEGALTENDPVLVKKLTWLIEKKFMSADNAKDIIVFLKEKSSNQNEAISILERHISPIISKVPSLISSDGLI